MFSILRNCQTMDRSWKWFSVEDFFLRSFWNTHGPPPPPTDDKRSSKKCASRMGGKDFKIIILKTTYQESEPYPHPNGEVIDMGTAAIILNFGVQQTWFKQLTQHVYSYSRHCSSHFGRRTYRKFLSKAHPCY